MKTKIEKHIIRNRRMLTVAETLFFAGAVFQITADKWPEGIIYFGAAACFASLERACAAGEQMKPVAIVRQLAAIMIIMKKRMIYRRKTRMKDYIAYCGLDCETCEAHIATVKNDNDLRIKVAKEWSELNRVEITPEMINCAGCRIDGVKTPFCDSLCPIRQCALSKDIETCGDCSEMSTCEKLKMITGNNEEALKRLEG